MDDDLTLAKLEQVSWYPFSDEPMIHSQWYMPRLCDPCFLFPEQSPDGKWHLFAHTWVGLEHFSSANGIVWEPLKMIEVRGHSPFIHMEDGVWYLFYEKHDNFLQRFNRRNKEVRDLSSSRFEVRSSTDLVLFSEPKVVLDASEVPFASDGLEHPRISRPEVFKVEGGYRLYFGASHIVLEGTKQKVTRYFATATSSNLAGPYAGERILLAPEVDNPYRNMATGSVKVVRLSDGFAAFDCAFHWNREKERNESAIIKMTSTDGISFRPMSQPVMLSTPSEGWASRFLTSCDVKYKKDERCWYCYYSANSRFLREDHAQESVGLLLGRIPALRPFPTR